MMCSCMGWSASPKTMTLYRYLRLPFNPEPIFMREMVPDQRNYFYGLESVRVGIHQPILAALYEVHHGPRLSDGEFGLGIAPANRISPSRLDSFSEQVHYAANTIRRLIDRLIDEGWKSDEFWNAQEGRYSDALINRIAEGYTPTAADVDAGLLESSDRHSLHAAYLRNASQDWVFERPGIQRPEQFTYLDGALLDMMADLVRYFQGLAHQREAILDAFRIWYNHSTREEAIATLLGESTFPTTQAAFDRLDRELIKFVQTRSSKYEKYPHQREALLRLAQLWRRLNTREEAIASLKQTTSPETTLDIVDPALMALVQRISQTYTGRGDQRTTLMEGFRLWQGLDSRKTALMALGIDDDLFSVPLDSQKAQAIAQQIDYELLAFMRRIPSLYQETSDQREALIRLTQLWRQLNLREAAIQSLLDDIRRMEQSKPGSPDNIRVLVAPLLPRPTRWSPDTIQIAAPIIANGHFTWAEATCGGQYMPPDQATVDAIVRIAQLAQQARDRIGRPFHITTWYCPPAPAAPPPPQGIHEGQEVTAMNRHAVGDAIDYYVEGLTGDELYRLLDPWWSGGLGRYGGRRALLGYLDAGHHRARWRCP